MLLGARLITVMKSKKKQHFTNKCFVKKLGFKANATFIPANKFIAMKDVDLQHCLDRGSPLPPINSNPVFILVLHGERKSSKLIALTL